MNTAKMLKDLLERVESGEVVITNLDVTNDEEDGVLTGEQYITITTWPTHGKRPKKTAFTADELFGSAKVWPDLTPTQKERLTALEGELAANESCFVFNPAGNSWRVAVYERILKKAEELRDEIDCRTKGYAQAVRLISRLTRKIEVHKNG
jgi:hypothetical protein